MTKWVNDYNIIGACTFFANNRHKKYISNNRNYIFLNNNAIGKNRSLGEVFETIL